MIVVADGGSAFVGDVLHSELRDDTGAGVLLGERGFRGDGRAPNTFLPPAVIVDSSLALFKRTYAQKSEQLVSRCVRYS